MTLKNIIHITRAYFPISGGYSVRVANEIKYLNPNKYKIYQFTSPRSSNKGISIHGEEVTEDNIITYHSYNSNRYEKRKSLPILKTLKRYGDITYLYKYAINKIQKNNIKPDIIHGHNDALVGWVGYKLSRFYNVPFIYDVHAFSFDEENSFHGIKRIIFDSIEKKMQKFLINRAANVVCISKSQRDYIKELYNIYDDKYVVYYNGVNREIFKPLNIKLDGIVIGVNASKEGEGANNILAIFDKLVESIPEIKLKVFLGHELCLLPKFEKIYDNIKSKNRIEFINNLSQEELNEEYNNISLYIMLRDYTIQNNTIVPLKPFEIMSAGCLLLVSDVGGLTEIIEDNYNGYIYKKEENLLSEKIIKILKIDNEIKKKVRINAIKTTKNFLLTNNIKVIENLYEKF